MANELSVNVDKTNFLFFSKTKEEPPTLNMQDGIIKSSEVVRYLGILINNKLSWSHQINAIKLKICHGLGAMYSTRFLVPPEILRNIYFCLVQSHLLYGITIWGSPNISHTPLTKITNKCIKLLKQLNPNTTILSINQLYQIESCKLIHNHLNKLLPPKIQTLFNPVNRIHHHNTRQAVNRGMHVPHFSSYLPIKSLACRYWNTHCPDTFQANCTKFQMVKKLKTKFFE